MEVPGVLNKEHVEIQGVIKKSSGSCARFFQNSPIKDYKNTYSEKC